MKKTKTITKHQPFLLIGIALALGFPILSKFFKMNFEAIIGLMCFPFVISFKKETKFKFKWAIVSALFLVLYVLTGIMTANYFAIGFLIFFLLENIWGSVNWPSLALLFAVSPFFNYIIKILSFPLRIQLTKGSVAVLSVIHPDLEAHGNVIQNGEVCFSVDPECMGLNLIVFSLGIGLAILVHFEKGKGHLLNFWRTLFFIVILLLLSILGNYFRIILITLFESKPETLSHEMIGIFCLIIYTIVPFYFIAKRYFKRKVNCEGFVAHQKPISKTAFIIYLIIAISSFVLYFTGPKGRHDKVDEKFETINLEGFQKSIVNANIIKLENDSVLVYIKPPVGFFGADHTPTICWSGSGYAIKNQKETLIQNAVIQTAELVHNNGDTLYTAWWFDNGIDKTGLQLEWRKKSLNGADPFRLINVITNSLEQTYFETKKLLLRNLFN